MYEVEDDVCVDEGEHGDHDEDGYGHGDDQEEEYIDDHEGK